MREVSSREELLYGVRIGDRHRKAASPGDHHQGLSDARPLHLARHVDSLPRQPKGLCCQNPAPSHWGHAGVHVLLDPDLRIPWRLMPLPGDPDKTHQCVHMEGTPHPLCVHQELTATPCPQFSIPSSVSESCHCSRVFLSPCPNQELPGPDSAPQPCISPSPAGLWLLSWWPWVLPPPCRIPLLRGRPGGALPFPKHAGPPAAAQPGPRPPAGFSTSPATAPTTRCSDPTCPPPRPCITPVHLPGAFAASSRGPREGLCPQIPVHSAYTFDGEMIGIQ